MLLFTVFPPRTSDEPDRCTLRTAIKTGVTNTEPARNSRNLKSNTEVIAPPYATANPLLVTFSIVGSPPSNSCAVAC